MTMLDDKSKTRLSKGESKGHIVLKVAEDAAPIENVPIAVTAFVSVNFVVKMGYSSQDSPDNRALSGVRDRRTAYTLGAIPWLAAYRWTTPPAGA